MSWEWKTMKGWYAQQEAKVLEGGHNLGPDMVEFTQNDPAPTPGDLGTPPTSLVEQMAIAQNRKGQQPEAAVVPVGWLFQQLVKCTQHGQETIRIVAGSGGQVWIQMWQNPDGWGNDWPKIDLP
jgi:hypothetical protein